jgi:hypothetical protein
MNYEGVNPDIWEMLSDEERRHARRVVAENYVAQYGPRPCSCNDAPGCPCPCHRDAGGTRKQP